MTQIAEDLAKLLLSMRSHRSGATSNSASATSRNGAVFARRNDGAFLVSDKNIVADVYTLNAIDGGKNVAAIRLEVLTDSTLPNLGPGRHPSGNFQLSAFRLLRPPIEGQPSTFVPFSAAYASYAYSASPMSMFAVRLRKAASRDAMSGVPQASHTTQFLSLNSPLRYTVSIQ